MIKTGQNLEDHSTQQDDQHQEEQPRAPQRYLIFPPGRFSTKMKKLRGSKRYGQSASVFMAAVIQYLVGEIALLAGLTCQMHKKRRITPRHLQIAFTEDEELLKLVANTLFATTKMPFIHAKLFPARTIAGL